MRDHLELFFNLDWVALEHVADFLRQQHVGDQELICYSASTTHLLTALDVRPASRFLYPSVYSSGAFVNHREANWAKMKASGARYIVSDMQDYGLGPQEAAAEVPGQPLALPPALAAGRRRWYPLSEPVVFRAGRYYVHAASPVAAVSPAAAGGND